MFCRLLYAGFLPFGTLLKLWTRTLSKWDVKYTSHWELRQLNSSQSGRESIRHAKSNVLGDNKPYLVKETTGVVYNQEWVCIILSPKEIWRYRWRRQLDGFNPVVKLFLHSSWPYMISQRHHATLYDICNPVHHVMSPAHGSRMCYVKLTWLPCMTVA